jgi:hypothetical protein
MNYKVGIKTLQDAGWVFNGLVFETEKEANDYRIELFTRWTSLIDSRIFETDEPANVRLENYHIVYIDSPDIKIRIKGEDQ